MSAWLRALGREEAGTIIDIDPSILYSISARCFLAPGQYPAHADRASCGKIDCTMQVVRRSCRLSSLVHAYIPSWCPLLQIRTFHILLCHFPVPIAVLFYQHTVCSSSCHTVSYESQRCHVRLFVPCISPHLTEIAPPVRHPYAMSSYWTISPPNFDDPSLISQNRSHSRM